MCVLVFKLLPVSVFSVCGTLVVCAVLCWFLGEDKCLKKSSYLLDILNWLLVVNVYGWKNLLSNVNMFVCFYVI